MRNLNFDQFKNNTWTKHWAGHFNVVYNTMLGDHNTGLLRSTFGIDLEQALYIYKEKYTFAYFEEKQYQKFGAALADKIIADEKNARRWCSNFVSSADNIHNFIKQKIGRKLTPEDWEKYVVLFNNYSTWHRAVKVAIDFLPINLKQKYLASFTAARLHAEAIYDETEQFIQILSQKIAAESGYAHNPLLALTVIELRNYLENKTLPPEPVLAERSQGYAIVFKNGHYTNYTGGAMKTIENLVTQKFSGFAGIKGKTAYPGIVTGRAQIVFDPHNAPDFKTGDILITGMTRPEFLPLMKKASAFVTDAGGLLSHAAITARELKKPCLVGTEIGSKTFANGDMVEVDATNGTVRKI